VGTHNRAKSRRTGNLLKGEKVSFREDAANPKASDEELNSRYAKGDIRIVTESARYSLAGILAMLRETVEGQAGQKELRYKLVSSLRAAFAPLLVLLVLVPPVEARDPRRRSVPAHSQVNVPN
jgi:hypothetical protein